MANAALNRLDPRLLQILGQDYPRFTQAEMERRRMLIEREMDRLSVDCLIAYGADGSGSAVQWLTGWPVTREAAAILFPGAPVTLLVQFYNHVPNARQVATDVEVHWGGLATLETAAREVALRRGIRRLGLVGPVRHDAIHALKSQPYEVVNMDRSYAHLRLLKSPEEIDWFRIGAWLSDLAIEALQENLKPGLSERELAAIVESAYLPYGGTNLIHFFGLTSMAKSDRCVPAQFPSTRSVSAGDALTVEISASFWRYPGQVLRTFAVKAEPTALYLRLHETAELVYRRLLEQLRPGVTIREVAAVQDLITASGLTIYDDLIHGFDGGYQQPVLVAPSRPAEADPAFVFEAGMTVVVQPNIITPDEKAGVQFGELVVITERGAQSLHDAPSGLLRVD